MNKTIVNVLKFLLFVGLGLGILYLVYDNQNTAYLEECAKQGVAAADCSLMQKVIDDFKSANYIWIVIVLFAFTFSNVSRAIRWKMLINTLGYSPRLINAFFTTILGYFANLGFPRLGEIVRPASLSRYEQLPVEKILGTVVLDRIMDVISILIVSALALALEYKTIWNALNDKIALGEKFQNLWASSFFWGFLLIVITGFSAFYFFRKQLSQSKIGQKLINMVQGFAQGLRTISQIDRPGLFIFHSINIWLMYFLMTYLCFFAFAPTANLPAVAALLVFVFGGWGIVIPSPGGMGTYHFLAVIALSIYGVSGTDAFSFANISFFSIQIGSNVILGLLALLLLPIINKDYVPAHVKNSNPELSMVAEN